jgi:hypothetical protein
MQKVGGSVKSDLGVGGDCRFRSGAAAFAWIGLQHPVALWSEGPVRFADRPALSSNNLPTIVPGKWTAVL